MKIFLLTIVLVACLFIAYIVNDHFSIAIWAFNAGVFAMRLRNIIIEN